MSADVVAFTGAIVMLAVGAGGRNRLASIPRTPLAGAPPKAPRHRLPRQRWRSLPAPVVPILLVVGTAVIAGWLPACIGLATYILWSRMRPALAARRDRSAVERRLPDAFDFLVLAVRAGLTPQQAIRELATTAPAAVRPAFVAVAHRCDRGQPFAEALRALPEILGTRAAALADVIATSDRYGLPLGPVLDQLSVEARDARRRIDQTDARKLPVRLSFPLVVCTLPSFVLLAIAPAVIAALSSLGATAW